MDALVDGRMVRVAYFDEGTQSWTPTQAGRDLVMPPPEPVDEPKKPQNMQVRQKRGADVPTGLSGGLPDL